MLACEIMVTTPAIQNLIRESKTYMISSILQTKADQSMRTMSNSLYELIQRKAITLEEALSRCPNPEELEKMFNKSNGDSGS